MSDKLWSVDDLVAMSDTYWAEKGPPKKRGPCKKQSMIESVTIFMPLANEGVDCWRPIEARPVGADLYEVLGLVPKEEEWQFPPGSLVHCAPKTFEDGRSGLIAVSAHRISK